MPQIKMSQIRAQFPMYADMNDDQLLIGLRKKYYADIPSTEFYGNIDRDTERAKLNKETTDAMPWYEKFGAGAGKTLADIGGSGKRIANMVGIGDYDQAAAQEDEERDRPLMDTGWGKAGKFTGDLALTALPALRGAQLVGRGVTAAGRVLPRMLEGLGAGIAPYVGGAAAGAATGAALAPEDMEHGAKMGGIFGPVGEAGGRVLTGVYGGAKAVLEPLYQAGRERILRRTLERFATNPQAAQAAARNPREIVPGYTPTLAEATMDPGLAQLQRGSQTMPGVASELAEANTQRLNAYRDHLNELAGSDGRREFHEGARHATAQQQYGRAYAEGMPGMTPEIQETFNRLMQRPSIQNAMTEARRLAREADIDLGAHPEGSVAGLHWVKQAIDDQITEATLAGRHTLAGQLRDTQRELVAALQEASPAYGEALATYAQMSRPINQMQIGRRLHNTLLPSVNDMSEDAFRATGNSYATAVNREGAQTARAATGMNNATLENTLEPAQLQTVRGISEDVSRNTRAQQLGMIPGSQTAQYLGARNVLRGLLGPLGLPESAMDSMLGRVTSGLMSLPFRVTQSQTEELLARALRDPRVAAALMSTRDDPTHLARLLQPYGAQIGIQLSTE